MRRVTKKDKRRLSILVIILIPLLVIFISNMFNYWSQIYTNIQEKQKLEAEYKEKLEIEEKLKSEIVIMQDEEYIARYAREKYLYSKDGEIIIKIK